jgi:hypothetical protein
MLLVTRVSNPRKQNSQLIQQFLVLLTATNETSAFINRNIRDSYASRIKSVGTMGRDFKKRGFRKNGTYGHPSLVISIALPIV